MSATVNKDTVYVVGGYGFSKQILSIDFSGVTNYNEARARSWRVIGNLKSGLSRLL